jgi:hypothetical protein
MNGVCHIFYTKCIKELPEVRMSTIQQSCHSMFLHKYADVGDSLRNILDKWDTIHVELYYKYKYLKREFPQPKDDTPAYQQLMSGVNVLIDVVDSHMRYKRQLPLTQRPRESREEITQQFSRLVPALGDISKALPDFQNEQKKVPAGAFEALHTAVQNALPKLENWSDPNRLEVLFEMWHENAEIGQKMFDDLTATPTFLFTPSERQQHGLAGIDTVWDGVIVSRTELLNHHLINAHGNTYTVPKIGFNFDLPACYDYPRALVDMLRQHGWTVDAIYIGGNYAKSSTLWGEDFAPIIPVLQREADKLGDMEASLAQLKLLALTTHIKS